MTLHSLKYFAYGFVCCNKTCKKIDMIYIDGPSDPKIRQTHKGNFSRQTPLSMFVIYDSLS